MRRGWRWLHNAWGRVTGQAVAEAYVRKLGGAKDIDAGLIIKDLARYCNVANSSFSAKDPTGIAMAFNEGQRDVFNHIAELIGLDPTEFRNLFKESSDDD